MLPVLVVALGATVAPRQRSEARARAPPLAFADHESGFLVVPTKRAWNKLLASDARVHLLSGAVAAAVSNTIVAPLDVIRLNIMVSKTPLSAMSVVQTVLAQSGLAGFWRGNTADVARAVPASAIRFYSFAAYKANLPMLVPAALASGASISLLAGGFAGAAAAVEWRPLSSTLALLSPDGLGLAHADRGAASAARRLAVA